MGNEKAVHGSWKAENGKIAKIALLQIPFLS
jgi:hypothetical protein